MRKEEAQKLVDDTFTKPYDEERFRFFVNNLFHEHEQLNEKAYGGQYIWDAFKNSIVSYKRLAKFSDPEGMEIDVLAVKLPSRRTLENARTMQRNFIARYLNGSRGGALKDAALVAFYSDDSEDWRFSLVRMDYVLDEENQKIRKELTPARRYSFLVGTGEKTHTARQQLFPILQSPTETTLAELENAFNIETVTNEFFENYKDLYLRLKGSLDKHIKIDDVTRSEFETKDIDTADFAKRLLGQIVFLYFLQKKGWLGVERGAQWGTGPKDFLQKLYRAKDYDNFFNDVLEHLFYDALATERQTQDHFFPQLNCKIPFLNGGLFEPFKSYAWDGTDILLDDEIFADIFDVFDLYNFTVREDEPLDKEVAVDPEMLGKVFENLIPENERKGSGTFYTPREIVHYMCQESLINYLDAELNIESQPIQKQGQQALFADNSSTDLLTEYEEKYISRVPRDDIAEFIYYGDVAHEHDTTAQEKSQNGDYKGSYQHKIPESIRTHAQEIDNALASVKVCDPAIGSGAFPLGVMNEIVRARSVLNAYLGDENRTHYDFKRHAIQESIYGVDIEASAVDIAKLRLWLSLVVDEEDFGNIQPLPNLDYKVVSGNSLLGFPFDTSGRNDKLRSLTPLKEKYFDTFSPSKKFELRKKINEIINSEYDSSQTKKSLGYTVDFDFRWSFFEVFDQKRGFDIVIANPPYIDSEGMVNSGQGYVRDIISKTYKCAKGNWDIYIAFYELSFSLLNNKGVLAFITPDKWVSKPFGSALREHFIMHFHTLLNAGRKVFETAKVDAIVSIIRKPISKNIFISEYKDKVFTNKGTTNKDVLKPPYALDFLFSEHFDLLQKIETSSNIFSDFAECENACATSDAYHLKEFLSGAEVNEYNPDIHYKIVNTGTLDKYLCKWGQKEMTYLKGKYLYPIIEKSIFNKEFGRSYIDRTSKPKLILKGLTLLDAFIDFKAEFVPGKSTLVVPCKDTEMLKVLGALLNSTAVFFYIKEKYSASSYNGGVNFTKDMINSLPIPDLNDVLKNKLIGEVDKILSLDSFSIEKAQQNIRTIDKYVYQAFGLNDVEIKLIEEAVHA